MKRIFSFLALFWMLPFLSFGQNVDDIIQWKQNIQKTGDNTFELSVTATIKKGWHVYAQNPGGDGSQIPTEVIFTKNPNVKLVGKLNAVGKIVDEDIDVVGIIHYYSDKVTFKQKVEANKDTDLKGKVSFQVCDDQMCLPPADYNFSFALKDVKATEKAGDENAAGLEENGGNDTENVSTVNPAGNQNAENISKGPNDNSQFKQGYEKQTAGAAKSSSLWTIFITGLVAGLAAFVTPCIYAMLPITVSFFTKRSKDKATGLKNATIYSLSIIGIFLLVGVLISVAFSETTMYTISTSVAFNLFVFAVFAIFGVSLLGAFEITLPSSWSSKLDSKASTSSFWGIFFMALVLVVVSFSCTSAFISFLIVEIVQAQNRLGGLIGFLGFGMSIALPFALFAFFPGWLNSIAKSGGWLNSVKVSMGFVELAMAMKFLSNVDLQYHWGLLDYNVYLAIWVILSGLLGIYLLGKIKFSNDDDLPVNAFGQRYISVPRLFFAMASLSFAVYMIPGMFGAPMLGISGWLPEKHTLNANFYDKIEAIQNTGGVGNGAQVQYVNDEHAPKKYIDFLSSALPGVPTYFDLEEGLAVSKAVNKPVLIDFTGHSCVNCRKMEAAVLKSPQVVNKIKNDFIFISLYADERHELAEGNQYFNKDGKKIKTIGEQNIDIEVNRYGVVGQPYYLFVDSNGDLLENAGGYVPDVERFINIMSRVKKQYHTAVVSN